MYCFIFSVTRSQNEMWMFKVLIQTFVPLAWSIQTSADIRGKMWFIASPNVCLLKDKACERTTEMIAWLRAVTFHLAVWQCDAKETQDYSVWRELTGLGWQSVPEAVLGGALTLPQAPLPLSLSSLFSPPFHPALSLFSSFVWNSEPCKGNIPCAGDTWS